MKLRKATVHLLLDIVIGVSFLVEAISGFVLWLVLTGGYQGGRNPRYGRTFVFSRDTWIDIHDWFAVAMTVGILVHIVLHWRWIVGALRNAWRQAFPGPVAAETAQAGDCPTPPAQKG